MITEIFQLIDNSEMLPSVMILKYLLMIIYISQLVDSPEMLPLIILKQIIVTDDLYFPTYR